MTAPVAPLQGNEPTRMDLAHIVLEEVWGYPAFRGVQEKVIARLLMDNANALCLMPTGGGKSLCYQVPALILPGLTLVISPLIALMKDQVDALRLNNVPARSMDSSLSPEEMAQVRTELREKTLKILYVAPERLANEMFVELMMEQEISLLAIDESHCISEWGASFRPSYLAIARFAKESGAQRVLCLTATATKPVVKDICDAEQGFDICMEKGLFQTGAFRPNLSLLIKPAFNLHSKISLLVPFLKSRGEGQAIVYATTQFDAESVVAALKEKGIESRFYHAGVQAKERKDVQNWFLKEKNGVVVATIAFGMGIDVATIRQVVHFHIPKTLENYSQEVGRAGRDGLPATCLMMPCAADLPVLESFARSITPSRNSIRDWLVQVFKARPASDGTIDFSCYEQSNTFDISRNTLGLLYANLDLQNNLLREATPFYSSYNISPSKKGNPSLFNDILSERNNVATLIRKHWKKTGQSYNVDVVQIVENEKVERSEVVRQLSRWEMQGCCDTRVSGVRNRYLPLKELPTDKEEIEKIADAMFLQMREREEADVKRLYTTAAFVTRSGCLAHGLASYFGDETSVPNGECGNCSWCTTRRPVVFEPKAQLPLDESKIKSVLSTCGVRDDARLLARLAFGISSPRLTQLGLSKHPVFRSCENSDFTLLVERFEAECEKDGWTNKARLVPEGTKPGRGGAAFAKADAEEKGTKRPFKATGAANSKGTSWKSEPTWKKKDGAPPAKKGKR